MIIDTAVAILGSGHLLESVGDCQDTPMPALSKACHRATKNQRLLAASQGERDMFSTYA
ncbi:hypothetical protein ACVIHH_000044 [Bradyrhizobium sp. USDA 4518]